MTPTVVNANEATNTLPAAPVGTPAARDTSAPTVRSALELAPWLERHPVRTASQIARYRGVKRIFDVAAVVVAAPAWAPVAAGVAAAVKLTDPKGGVLFSQLRTGTGQHRFRLYKFRSMVHNAEELKASLAHLNERTWPDFKITNDPRITPIGKFIRKTSLDELPQLFNVLKGDLSLVGPRPTTMTVDKYEPWQLARFNTVAGLTGLWQITARSEQSFNERIVLDLAYIERQSLRLDLAILARTLPAMIGGAGS